MTDEHSSEAAKAAKKSKAASKAAPKAKGKKVAPYVPTGLEAVLLRNNFYRNNYRRMVSLSLLLTLAVAGLGGFIFYQHLTRPVPKYFATTEGGKLFQIKAVSNPGLTDNELFEWAMQAAISSYTYDFVNYRKELSDVKAYYTAAGHASLLKAIDESRNLEAVKTKKMTTSARVTGQPQILRRGKSKSGPYMWIVEFPMEVLYTNGKPQDLIIQRIVVSLTITRMNVWESSMGVGIKSFIVRPDTRPTGRGAG